MTLDAFGTRELDVLRVLWQRGPSTVAEVREALQAPLAYTTVLTILRSLEVKEAVEHAEEGKAHRYRARLAHSEAQRSAVGTRVERLFEGNVESLLTHLLDARGLSEHELRRLHALLGERLDGADGGRRDTGVGDGAADKDSEAEP